ncbi:DeoR/GlpR family DNA-binding transcription regulator [Paracoccus sp. PAR01]|uniref:DeoR/GlpR family DNA-binding transcription regulator n=1 Tax=Paracoccus sp. PAR01 TaxID=2769282 RepID=UPI00178221CF|nr:transcriptional regulator [Paracoccus sp. PAR01]MBD9527287.1 transcriptional regulator [Paracoccus sp. PAR01]
MQQAPDDKPLHGAALWAAVLSARDSLPAKLRAIAAFVAEDPSEFIRMTSREICARLGTSEPTLIRFCRSLGFAGLAEFRIELALALAAQSTGAAVHPQAADRRLANPEAKRRIAAATMELLADDRAVLIDNGSTVELVAESLGQSDDHPAMTIMTSGLMVAQHAMRNGRHRVMLTGGVIRPSTGSLTGRLAESSLAGMNFDTFVMGADSIDPEGGLSTYSEDEAHVTRAMVDASSRVIVLADHTKFRASRLHRICGLSRVAILITDRDPTPEIRAALDAATVRLIVAKAAGIEPKDKA